MYQNEIFTTINQTRCANFSTQVKNFKQRSNSQIAYKQSPQKIPYGHFKDTLISFLKAKRD